VIMMNPLTYPKRLIEVDLPIKKISAHARREKSIRHGHISTLHIWWARRPLAACRAVICAALWPDPAQEDCPLRFREDAAVIMARFWNPIGRTDLDFSEPLALRKALLDFIADFANWDNSTKKEYLETARALTQSAHEALGGAPGTRPLVVDPFAGGGSIPLEALRVGADAFASDLNPVAVLLNKVVLEYIPKYGQTLADEVRKWGEWIKVEAEKELGEFYPKDPDGAVPIAYLWARTITCEGPGCGAEVPLMRSLWLAKKSRRSVALKFIPDREKRRVDFEIIEEANAKDVGEGTVRRGSATCPICGYTTPVASVRTQLKARRGGAADARLFCVVTTRQGEQGRFYRQPTERDLEAVRRAAEELERRKAAHTGELSLVPDEPTPQGGGSGAGRAFSQRNYGMDLFEDLFTSRQALALTTLARLVREAGRRLAADHDSGMAGAVQTLLGCTLDRESEHSTSLCRWNSTGQKIQATFSRQALPMMWDFSETNILGNSVGSWDNILETTLIPFETAADIGIIGQAESASATSSKLSDDSARLFFTDPPYYDAIPYSDLSDFFYSWLKRTVLNIYPALLKDKLTPKDEECIVDEVKGKDKEYFETTMAEAMAEGRRVLTPDGIGVVVFAHKSTSGWEAMLQAMIDAGWTFTGSWPIDTEMGTRLRAMDSAALASSIHLVCRPREDPRGEIRTDDVGYWSDVLTELPQRIHAWLPGLAAQGVVGADAIFSCLGPALEIYSRYSRVEKASGEVVTLKEYLEEVWAAVSREALGMIFEGADGSGLEEDARLTAMWLWTLSTGGNGGSFDDNEADASEGEDGVSGKGGKMSGFVLEYDAARKIAQGLGAHLETLSTLVEVKGDKARLLPVLERSAYLFGQGSPAVKKERKRKKELQTTLSGSLARAERETVPASELALPAPGSTVLDRLHQAMLLFSTGRSDALKRFIEEDIGQDQGLWSLAQSLSALYPAGSDERRWVEGVLARKKGLGL
jgi:adenine-specific DNA methylase